MKFTEKEVLRKTDNAICIEIENQKLWFQKKKILINPDNGEIEITESQIEDAKTSFEEFKNKKEEKIKIISNETVEDYNANVYKFRITLEINDEEKKTIDKICFVSKKLVSVDEIKDNEIIVPLWIWNKIEEDSINESVEYAKKTYNSTLTNRDYKVLNTTNIIE